MTARSTVALALVTIGCGRQAGPVCPPGTTGDLARAAAIEARLAASPSAGEALAGHTAPICFVVGERSTVSEGVIRVDEALGIDAAAARVAHLRLHVGDSALSFTGEAPCDEQVAAALRAEARGYDLELRVARELGAPSAGYAFEPAWAAAPPAATLGRGGPAGSRPPPSLGGRAGSGWVAEAEEPATDAADRLTGPEVITQWLVANPDGGPGVDGLGADYARRCAAGR